jgi:dihydrofolate synthase/folylpolyglutamate synthase
VTYAEAEARVQALRGGEHAGMRPGLERMEALLDALGRPERRLTLVQVGGTNGKGSVSALLAAMLEAAGHRVGLYTSPHLRSLRERIRVNGELIAEDALADGVDALGTLVARHDASMFEAMTLLALDHFAREAVDVAVLEVGLGGRLDATTVGAPAATVVARIDYDHQEHLGRTLAEIAAEKAAIIRSGFAVSAAQAPEALAVVRARARAAGVPLLVEGIDLDARILERGLGGQRVTLAGPGWTIADARLALLGRFQAGNALLATTTARGLGLDEAAIRAGLARTRWPGRFQVLPGEPRLVLDGAHNPNGAQALAASLVDYFGEQPKTLIVGVSADKDARGILGALVPLASRVILTAASNPRAAKPADLLEAMPPTPADVVTAGSVEEALALAYGSATTPIICVAGSLFLIAEALGLLSPEAR